MTKKFKPKPGAAKIEYITAQLSPPSSSNEQGVVAESWFTVIGGELSLTDRNGKPVRDGRAKLYIRQLHKDEDPRRAAQRMLKDFDSATRGNKSDFNRSLNYPRTGIV